MHDATLLLGQDHATWGDFTLVDAGEGRSAAGISVGSDPSSPSIRYHLALALSDAGEDARARELLQSALDAGAFPEFEEARQKLEQIGQL